MGNTNSSSSRNSGSTSGANGSNNATPPRSLRARSASAQQQLQQHLSGSTASSTSTSRPSGTTRNSRSASKTEETESPPLYPQEATVDNGHLVPLSNIYPNAPQEWLRDTVQSLIVQRKLAPFYRGLEDYNGEDDFDKDELDKALDEVGDERAKMWRKSLYSDADRKAEAAMYKEASECPICFLYYPPLINTSRCCDQPICTECFVQIKRADPTSTNLLSEPAACPFCVESNFGVTYIPPPVNRRTGLGAPKSTLKPGESERPTDALNRAESADSSEIELGPAASAHSRRKSLSHTAAEVVTVDSIQPDWEAKLAAIRATAARRAARRVVFRQIGERLVPVGISSGREINPNHLITDDQGRLILTTPVPVIGQGREANTSSMIEAGMIGRDGPASSGFASPSRLLGRSSRRRGTTGSSSNPLSEADHRLLLGGDLEELMVMEAMRLSMLDEEERRKKNEKDAKAQAKKQAKESKSKRRSSNRVDADGTGETSNHTTPASAVPPNVERSSTPRGSIDAARSSLDNARAVLTGKGKERQQATASSSRSSIDSSNNVNGTANTNTSKSSSSSFLKMPPMQRNDSTASMARHDLMPPMVPSKAQPGQAVHRETTNKQPEVQRTYSDLLL